MSTSTELPTVHECECSVCQAGADDVITQQHVQMNLFLSRLTEPQRRWYVGLLSQAGSGPTDRQLYAITGLDTDTIRRGRQELAAGLPDTPPNRQRRLGGGRPATEKKIPR
jgi:hypothetical protein